MIHYNFVDGNSVVGSNVPCIPSSPLKRLNQQLLTRHITMYKTVAYPGEKTTMEEETEGTSGWDTAQAVTNH